MTDQDWMAEVRSYVGKQYGRVYAWDKVNSPMIRQWCELMGVAVKTDREGKTVAPPAMLQVWCMEGPVQNNYPPGSTTENPYEVLKLIEAQGFPSTVAVNSELSFERDVLEGEDLYYTTRLEAISEEKTTALGTGYFVTQIMEYFSIKALGGEDEKVGQLMFRVFKFRPANVQKAEPAPTAAAKIKRPAPGVSDDNRFFWEGLKEGKLLIQRCKSCGDLHHPPGPVCPQCHSFDWDTVEASGQGTVYSFVVMHYPEVPPFDHPNPIGLVELQEGVRVIAQLVGVKPGEVQIGQKVQVEFNTFDGDLTLAQFRPVA
ncbi:DNA-binding protein [Comamonas testosteroni TK102]|uniref:DNA-binding protein n=1 Tax=Comamonas testosteroni TK102 TaxID=1392005 RepID=A0A076PFW8_COMTE|nr:MULTISPECIES: Zn-ribbon domain-containing OB-fold protein [Comamonas]AIJ45674.1 DNA-binding protein [Comamonas testosteroni TK102]MPS87332.1 Zn-ribbon domain-containing OB-fold protein [Comamonas sp.]